MTNPFAGVGSIVEGQRFVGRKKEIQKLKACTFGSEYNNVAIMGLPRIGKSSLARQTFMQNKEELSKAHTYVIWINVGCFQSDSSDPSVSFFKEMVFSCHNEIKENLNPKNDKYTKNVSDTLQQLKEESSYNTIRELVIKYFKRLRKSLNYKIIFILDEFDSVKNFFTVAEFQLLRELAYNPDTKICLVTTSRKNIEDIEVKEGTLSNFSGIFTDLRLGVFSEEDTEEYWSHFHDAWPVDKQYISDLFYLTGNHPWLMDVINSHLFQENIKEKIIEYIPYLNLMENLDGMVSTLEKEEILDAAIQVVIGPRFDVTQKQIEQLERYQFIRKVSIEKKKEIFNGNFLIGPKFNDYAYACFSDYSTLDFFRRYYANIPYFTIWSETENMLRDLVKEHIDESDIDKWQEKAKEILPKKWTDDSIKKWNENIDKLKNNRARMTTNFPQLQNEHFVFFTLTSQIFNIFIQPDYKWYNNNIFKGSWEKWTDKFKFLANLRDPLAHNQSCKLEDLINEARTYCSEIKNAIIQYKQRHKSK